MSNKFNYHMSILANVQDASTPEQLRGMMEQLVNNMPPTKGPEKMWRLVVLAKLVQMCKSHPLYGKEWSVSLYVNVISTMLQGVRKMKCDDDQDAYEVWKYHLIPVLDATNDQPPLAGLKDLMGIPRMNQALKFAPPEMLALLHMSQSSAPTMVTTVPQTNPHKKRGSWLASLRRFFSKRSNRK